MNTFEKRHDPAKFGNLPLPVVFLGPVCLVFAILVIITPFVPMQMVFASVVIGIGYQIYDVLKYYKDWHIRNVLIQGAQMKWWPTFGEKKVYSDVFCWKTYVGDHGIMLRDGSVAIAFSWDGVQNRYYDASEMLAEHERRVALLKSTPIGNGFCIEHHFNRLGDASLIDAYEAEGEAMHRGNMPPIVSDIRKQVAEMYRPIARSNKVVTVISTGAVTRKGFFSFLLPSFQKQRAAETTYSELIDTYKKMELQYSGAQLMSHAEFAGAVDHTLNPYSQKTSIDWRFDLCDQLIIEKPLMKDGCIQYRGTYYKVLLLQNYPDLSPAFAFKYSEGMQDVHVSQILFPLEMDKTLDQSADDQKLFEVFTANNKGVEISQTRTNDMASYRNYVAARRAPVFDNCFVITLSGSDPDIINRNANALELDVKRSSGLLRSDDDVQREMFRARLPGLGRTTLFARNDHIDTVAAMMPFTVYNAGSENPESLRISASGQLVGFSPSAQAVPHELVVAETGGGKDTQYGLKVLETYKRIRWDFIELGNTYQGLIEAIGGRYCRAKEQVINPLAGYEDFDKAVALEAASGGTYRIVSPMIASQSIAILPLLKGLKAESYDVNETIVVERAIRRCYEHRNDSTAPTMPFLAKAFDAIEIDNDRQADARDKLAERLVDWMKTETGQAFTNEDQFIISPIANAIDFAGVDGELLKYYMVFMCSRLANNAFARGERSQIVLNEYKSLLMKAPEPIHWITVLIDRMGRKDWVGLSRVTQGLQEIQSVDSEAINSIPNRTLLSRRDQHVDIGQLLKMPPEMVNVWQGFGLPQVMDKKGYREGMICEADVWYHLILTFPQLLLDLMNTKGSDKPLREQAYLASRDPYERIAILKKLQAEQRGREASHVREATI